jgi:hypothetical protein
MKCFKCGGEVGQELHDCVFGNVVDYRTPLATEVRKLVHPLQPPDEVIAIALKQSFNDVRAAAKRILAFYQRENFRL